MYSLWDKVVNDEEKIAFPSNFNFFSDDENEDNEIDDENINEENYNALNSDIQTTQTVKELQQT